MIPGIMAGYPVAGGGSSNKWQFEVVVVSGSATVKMAGIADKTNFANVIDGNIGTSGSTVIESVGYFDGGTLYKNLSSGVTSASAATLANGDIVTVAMDLSVPSVELFKNGSSIGSAGLPSGKTWYPAISLRISGSSCRLVPTSLTYPQSGYSDWGGTLDAAAKGAGITLSSGDLVATKAGTPWQSVYGTVGRG